MDFPICKNMYFRTETCVGHFSIVDSEVVDKIMEERSVCKPDTIMITDITARFQLLSGEWTTAEKVWKFLGVVVCVDLVCVLSMDDCGITSSLCGNIVAQNMNLSYSELLCPMTDSTNTANYWQMQYWDSADAQLGAKMFVYLKH